MKYYKIQKIAAPLLLVILILLVFLIFVRTRNISLQLADPDLNFTSHYIYSLLILVIGILLYIISNYLSKNYWLIFKEKEKYLKEITDIKNKNEEVKEEEVKKDKASNINEIVTKLIPNIKKTESIEKIAEELLINISQNFSIVIGIIYIKNKKDDTYSSIGTYAYYSDEPPKDLELGVSLCGQVAKDQKVLILSDIPENYLTVISGLGKGNPNNLLIAPVIHDDITVGIIELASFESFDKNTEEVFVILCNKMSDIFNKFIK